MKVDSEKVWLNARKATTEDLLDRVTAYRAGMTPEALEILEAELKDRGVGDDQIEALAERYRREAIFLPDGTAAKCSFCPSPAVARTWAMHRLLGVLPLFPRPFYHCEKHRR
jgi:hypothetical protein